MASGSGRALVLTFLIGTVLGLLLGWYGHARSTVRPGDEETPAAARNFRGAVRDFFTKAALVALVVVVFLVLAVNIAQHPGH